MQAKLRPSSANFWMSSKKSGVGTVPFETAAGAACTSCRQLAWGPQTLFAMRVVNAHVTLEGRQFGAIFRWQSFLRRTMSLEKIPTS